MSGFDDILKKGKDKVTGGSQGTTPKSKKDLWNDNISYLISITTKLNALYGDDFKHHFMLEQGKCKACGKATYLLTIKTIDDPKQVMRFHNAAWKVVGKDSYYCEICK